jgi:hypothetical protein
MQYPITYWFGIRKEFIYRADGSLATEEIDRVKDAGFTLMLAEFDVKTNKLVLEAAAESGAQWVIVEQDNPSMGLTPLECAEKSRNYLKSIGC